MAKILEKGMVEIIQDRVPGFYSRLFLVEKVSGSWRPVLGLLPSNTNMILSKFRMEMLASVLASIQKRDMFLLDLKAINF